MSANILGGRSLGSPTEAMTPQQISMAQGRLAQQQTDVVRRNALKRSSTAGTGADFVAQMLNGFEDQGPTPVGDPVQNPEPVIGLTEQDKALLADTRARREAELKTLQRKRTSPKKKNTDRGRNDRITELRGLLGYT